MSNQINSLGSLPDASGYMNARSPRQAGMGYGGYTGLNPGEEARARQFGDQAQNGNFWRGAALWTTGAAIAGGTTYAMERQWAKEGHSSYVDAKRQYLNQNLTDAHKTTLGITAGSEIDLKAVDKNFTEGFVKNVHQWDENPYKGVNKVLNEANDYAKVQMNQFDNANVGKIAEKMNITKTTGLAKAGIVAGAVLAGGLLVSHLSASGEGNAITQMAREHLAMLKAQEAMAQRGQA
jgi:hypothetical protein